MCGLLGWSGKDPKKFNINKFNILGILNETRGKHSCGISYNGEIYFGIGKEAEWRDFCAVHTNSLFKEGLHIPTVIGHTRHATVGSHSSNNAHPFGFGENNETFEGESLFQFIGAHNGSLNNYKELAKRWEVNLESKEKSYTRTKIDSEILLEIIFLYGYDVLSEYIGAAALLFYDTYNPNVMYAFHGKSSSWKNTAISEERPLYYYQETRNSLYVSSQEESLEIINDNGGEIGEFEHNVLYKITNGNIKTAEKTEIDRSKAYQKVTTTVTTTTTHTSVRNYNEKKENSNIDSRSSTREDENILFNIFKEKPLININDYNGGVFYNNLRYWSKANLCTGIYAPIKLLNLAKLGNTMEEAIVSYSKIDSKNKFNKTPLFLFMFEGVLLLTYADYIACMENPKTFSDVECLSHMSRYPIINIEKGEGLAIHYTSPANDEVMPILSKKIYSFDRGVVSARSIKRDESDKYENFFYVNKEDLPYHNYIDQESKKSREDVIIEQEKEFIEKSKEEIVEFIEGFEEEGDMFSTEFTKNSFNSALKNIKITAETNLNLCLSRIKK